MAELLSSKVVILEVPPSIRSLPTIPTGIAAFSGVAVKGPIGTATLVTSWAEYVEIFGSYDVNADMTLAVEDFFRNGGTAAFISRVVHYTDLTDPNTQTALKSSFDIDDRGGAAAPAIANSTVGPWRMANADQLDLDFDNGGTQNAVINATAAIRNNTGTAEPYNMSGVPLTLLVKIDQGPVQTITFVSGDFAAPATATAEEIAAAINAGLVGGLARVITGGTEVQIESDTLGTGSYVEVTGGTANAILNFAIAEVQGTGNVADVTQVTPAEIAAIITALPPAGSGTAVVSGSTVVLTSGATGATAEVEILGSSVQTTTIFTPAIHNGSDAGTNPTLRVSGKYYGAYGNNITIEIAAATGGDTDEFNLSVLESSVLKETFPNLSMTDVDLNYVEDVINDPDTGSTLIEVLDLDSPASSPQDLPEIGTHSLTGGDDGLSGLVDTDFIGNQAGPTGFYYFDIVQDIAIGPIVPNRCTSAVQNAQTDYAEITRGGSMFPPLGPPAGNTAQQIVTYVSVTATLEGKTEFGAIFWPRVKKINPSQAIYGIASELTIDPVGMIAGVFARTDAALPGGVYRAPAGIEYGQLVGASGFETDDVLQEGTRDIIATHRINPLTSFPGTTRFIDGHDTLKGDSNFPSIPERRGVIFIEQSIKRGLEVFRHAQNDQRTRNEAASTITAFLIAQMRMRAFRTQDPATAFEVDASDALNPPTAVFNGKLFIDVKLATNKPNQWIILSFSQDVRALQEEIASP